MTSSEFRNMILSKRPRYAKSRIPVIEALANKGTKTSKYSQFGPVYEIFVFAFILGFRMGLKLSLPPRNLTSDFLEIGKWRRDSKLVDFLLMVIFVNSDKIGFSWSELEDCDDDRLNQVTNDIIEFIESYANGGLEYLSRQMEEDSLMNSHYMFIDLLSEITPKTSEEDKLDENWERESGITTSESITSENTKDIIRLGESGSIEFKSTLTVNLATNQRDQKMEHQVLKTIAAFANSKGGTLLIGIEDDGNVLGLDNDLQAFTNSSNPLDKLKTTMDQLIENALGNAVFSLLAINFPQIDTKVICRIDVDPSIKGPVHLKNKISKSPEFYIRRAASSIALELPDALGYIHSKWN